MASVIRVPGIIGLSATSAQALAYTLSGLPTSADILAGTVAHTTDADLCSYDGAAWHIIGKDGRATLVAGTVTVSTALVTTNANIQLTAQSLGTVTVAKALAITARIAGTSFTITSADATDTSIVAWTLST